MNEIKNYFRKLKYRLSHDFLAVENIVLGLAVFMCLVWTYQSIVSMSRNWELAEKLNNERKNRELLALEIETAELENEYYSSSEYQELAARKLLNKQLPGEHLVVLPENSDVAKNKHQKSNSETSEKTYSNPEKWFMFLFPKT